MFISTACGERSSIPNAFEVISQERGTGDDVAKPVELYTSTGCPYSAAAREDLEWRGVDFVEYDVERDRDAYERMLELTGGNRTVPVIVEEGKPVQVGWMGQGCFV
jgi:glutaredoxin 3